MQKVEIFPGICGLITNVEAEMIDEDEVKVKVVSMCPNIRGMMEELGDEFEAFDLCLQKPGDGPFFDYAREHFPVHVSCPAICGIIKAVEAEAKLALPKSAHINFVD